MYFENSKSALMVNGLCEVQACYQVLTVHVLWSSLLMFLSWYVFFIIQHHCKCTFRLSKSLARSLDMCTEGVLCLYPRTHWLRFMLDSKLEPAVMEHGMWEEDTSNASTHGACTMISSSLVTRPYCKSTV